MTSWNNSRFSQMILNCDSEHTDTAFKELEKISKEFARTCKGNLLFPFPKIYSPSLTETPITSPLSPTSLSPHPPTNLLLFPTLFLPSLYLWKLSFMLLAIARTCGGTTFSSLSFSPHYFLFSPLKIKVPHAYIR